MYLGRYQLLRKIAEGGMARVYAARVAGASGFEKLVAIKQMLPEIGAREDMRRMFLDEARIAANIRSAHVVSTFDLGEADDGSPYIVMDLVVGCTISALVRGFSKQGRLVPLSVCVELLRQASLGLQDAHQATSARGASLQIVHRDVSPQNILVGVDGNARLTDFGVAHALERLTKTQGMRLKGKCSYCSPEQSRGEPLDARSDLFGLGVVAWELLCGRRLYKRAGPAECLNAIATEPAPDPRTVRADIPASVAYAVLQCLEKEPEHRFSSAIEFAEALRAEGPTPAVGEIQTAVQEAAGPQIEELVSKIRDALEDSPRGEPTMRQALHEADDPVARKTLATATFAALPTNFGASNRDHIRTAPGRPLHSGTFDAPIISDGPRAPSIPPTMVSPAAAVASPPGSSTGRGAFRRTLIIVGASIMGLLIACSLVLFGWSLGHRGADEAPKAATSSDVFPPRQVGISPGLGRDDSRGLEPTGVEETAPVAGSPITPIGGKIQPTTERRRASRRLTPPSFNRGASEDDDSTPLEDDSTPLDDDDSAPVPTDGTAQTPEPFDYHAAVPAYRERVRMGEPAPPRWAIRLTDGPSHALSFSAVSFGFGKGGAFHDCWSALPNPRETSGVCTVRYENLVDTDWSSHIELPPEMTPGERACVRALFVRGPEGTYSGTVVARIRLR